MQKIYEQQKEIHVKQSTAGTARAARQHSGNKRRIVLNDSDDEDSDEEKKRKAKKGAKGGSR